MTTKRKLIAISLSKTSTLTTDIVALAALVILEARAEARKVPKIHRNLREQKLSAVKHGQLFVLAYGSNEDGEHGDRLYPPSD